MKYNKRSIGGRHLFLLTSPLKTPKIYMLRIARVVVAGYPHHTTQRGNYRQKVFYYIKKESKGSKEFIEVPDNLDEMKGIREKPKLSWLLRINDFIERLEG